MPRCSCGAVIQSGVKCRDCALAEEFSERMDEFRDPDCAVCKNRIPPEAPTTSVGGQVAHAECGGQVRCDGGEVV